MFLPHICTSHLSSFGLNDFYEKYKTTLNFQNQYYTVEYKGEILNLRLDEKLDNLSKEQMQATPFTD